MTRDEIGAELRLLGADGTVTSAPLLAAPEFTRPTAPLRSRRPFAAAHVVPRTWSETTPDEPADLDWDATLDYRRKLYGWGLGVADAMDTAQRNMGLDAAATREVIRRSADVAHEVGGRLAVGVNTDSRSESQLTLEEIGDAYLEQLHFAEDAGTIPVLMASRHLAAAARDAADYARVYDRVLRSASGPVVLHWLGEAFDPRLRGYFGSTDWRAASDTLVDLCERHVDRVLGVKMSLLDADAERAVRARLPEGATMFTGDDYNYLELMSTGPDGRHSDALLGAFSVLAPNASAAVQALDGGDETTFRAILEPTIALSRQVFAAPTYFYKTGVAFLSWLNGHQPAFRMVGGLQSARSLPHLSRIVELANAAGALERPELARERWHAMLALDGIDVGDRAPSHGDRFVEAGR